MREIKFKARVAGTDGWVIGLPHSVYGTGIDSIQTEDRKIEYIRCDTLCQYSGMKDKNGVEIYEGDMINCIEVDIMVGNTTHNNCIVIFDKGAFFYCPNMNIKQPHSLLYHACRAEVIGNIHD